MVKGSYAHGHNPANVRSVEILSEDRGYKTPCHIWQGALTMWKYAKIQRDGKTHNGHRWFWEQRNGPVPEGYDLDHLCRVRHCVNPDHLEVVLPIENKRRGLVATLKEEDIPVIEQRYRNGESQSQIARSVGVGQNTISRILRNVRWPGVAVGVETRSPIKLTPEKVLEIRQRFSEGAKQIELAREFSMGQSQIGRIVRRESWPNLSIEEKGGTPCLAFSE
jgi:transposase